MYTCVYIHIYMSTHMDVCSHEFSSTIVVCTYVYTYICMFIHTCICILLIIYTYEEHYGMASVPLYVP